MIHDKCTGRRGFFHRALPAIAPWLLAVAGSAWAQSSGATVIEVQPGDTFSSIASRQTGDVGNWRSLYRADLSRLRNPDRIQAGMRLELVTDAKGARYLRVLPGLASGSAAAATAASGRPLTTTAPSPATSTAPPATTASPATPSLPPSPGSPPVTSATAPPAGSGGGLAPVTRGDDTLVIGVLPNIAAATLTTQYERLKRYLERNEGRKVQIVVPANFKAFFDATMRGDYDLAVAAPHFARVAQLDRKLIPLVTYEPRINALLVTPSESTISGPRDVRERAVGFANPQSLVAMYGQQWLKQAGLEPGRDYEMKAARTDLGVGRMLLTGDAVAAVLSNGEFRVLPPEESARMKVVEVIARIPNFVIMAHPRIERDRLGRLKAELKAFLADKEEGEPFAKATGFTGIIDADDALLREMDPFAGLTRRAMGVAN